MTTNDSHLSSLLGEVLTPDPSLVRDVIALGVSCFTWHGIDRELAALQAEPAMAMRTTERGDHYTFMAGDTAIDVACMKKVDHTVVIGWIDPIQEIDVHALSPSGETLGTAAVDETGRFRFVLTSTGPLRLEFVRLPVIVTDWFSISS